MSFGNVATLVMVKLRPLSLKYCSQSLVLLLFFSLYAGEKGVKK